MLSIRSRGKNGIYYIRGSVALGDKRIDVKEFSSGTSDADAASHLMAEYETKLRHQLMFGPAVLVAQGVMADAFDSYLSKAKPPCASDVLRIGKLNGLIGDHSLREPKPAWEHYPGDGRFLRSFGKSGADEVRRIDVPDRRVLVESQGKSLVHKWKLPHCVGSFQWLRIVPRS